MPLPSSGQISMSQINTEAGFASNKANSYTSIRTGDYAFSGVDQNAPYAFSEFYSKTYAYPANTATFYYYYPFDGGNGYNNPQVWGWDTQAGAEAHIPLQGPWIHTIYYNGALTNGTLLYIDQDPSYGRYASLYDAGTNFPPYTGAWYYIEAGSNSYVCQASSNTPTFTVSNLTILAYTINWAYIQSANSGVYQISKNGSLVVNVAGNNSSNFTALGTDYLYAYCETTATFPLNASSSLYVEDNMNVLYNSAATGPGFSSISYGNWYPTGLNYVNGDSSEF